MKLKDLNPDPRNANKGTARGQKMIVSSIQEDGFGRSGLLDRNGQIIAGNKTAEASAEVFGVDTDVIVVETDGKKPVYVKRTDLDLADPDPNNPARRLAYRDNLASRFSFELDAEVVMADIEAGFDFEGIDISVADFGELLPAVDWQGNGQVVEDEPPIDKAAELQEKWGTELGQLWRLGEHRVICGDCTDKAVVERVMGGELARMIFTDPPYNVGYKYNEYNDNINDYPEWTIKWVNESAKYLHLDSWFFIKNITRNLLSTLNALCNISEFANLIIWPHGTGAIPSNRFALGYECISVGRIGSPPFDSKAEVKATVISDERGGGINHKGRITDIWDDIKPVVAGSRTSKEALLNNDSKAKIHHAQMPEKLVQRALAFCTNINELVYDPFLGSGTTVTAAHKLNRCCFGVEIDPGYIAVSLERWHTLTGQMPELQT